MNGTPRVSILMPFLDEEPFIAEAIESVLAQRYGNWELILLDDGSEDGSTATARAYAGEHARIEYHDHPGHANRGTSLSRIAAFERAQGDLIAFLDADDLWLPDKLSEQVDLLEEFPSAGLVYGPALFWHHDDGMPAGEGPRDFVHELGVPPGRLIHPPSLLTLLLVNEDIHPANCSQLVRRSTVEEVGGFERGYRDMYEDTMLLAKLLLTQKVVISSGCNAIYRLHSASMCHTADREGHYSTQGANPSRGAYLSWLEAYLAGRPHVPGPLREALRCELKPYRQAVRFRIGRTIDRTRKSLKRTTRWRGGGPGR